MHPTITCSVNVDTINIAVRGTSSSSKHCCRLNWAPYSLKRAQCPAKDSWAPTQDGSLPTATDGLDYPLLWIADNSRPRASASCWQQKEGKGWKGCLRRTITATLATLAPAKKPDFPPVQGHRLFRGRMTWSRWSGKFHKPGIGRQQIKYQETSEIENIWQKIPWPEKCNWPI